MHPHINLEALKRQLRDGWLPLPESIIPPPRDANFLWRTLPEPRSSSKTLLDTLQDAVASSSKSMTGKVGLWLSGGFDSSTLLVLLCDIYGAENVVAYHLDCGYEDEIERVKLIANSMDVKLKWNSFTVEDHLGLLSDAVLYLRMPTDLTTQNLYIARMCLKDGIRTAYTALGLDEIQGGYIEHVRASEDEFEQVEARLLDRGRSHMAWFMSTLARGLDLKHPYLDKNLVAYSRSLPRNAKCRGMETKVLIRELMKDKMPKEIVEAGRKALSKRGFLPLIEEWWNQGLGKWVDEMIPLIPDYVETPTARSVYKSKIGKTWWRPKIACSYLKKMLTRRVYTPYWIKHRLATVPIFLDHLESGRYNS